MYYVLGADIRLERFSPGTLARFLTCRSQRNGPVSLYFKLDLDFDFMISHW